MRVAASYHRNHRRKASDLPYISHPASVALILVRAGFDDESLLAAALLHDVVEDTDCTLEELEAEFPAQVIQYVAALTERKNAADGTKRSWQERKNEHLAEVGQSVFAVRAIVLADKLHNLGSMLYDLEGGEELWSRFGASADKIIWYHRSMIAAAAQDDTRLSELARACEAILSRLEEAT